MAHHTHKDVLPLKAASAMAQYVAVALVADETVSKASHISQDVIGLTIATTATYGGECAVVFGGRAKAYCAASVGAGGRVGVASTNGALGPVVPTGIAQASGLGIRYAVGRALVAAVAGQIFTVILDPAEIV